MKTALRSRRKNVSAVSSSGKSRPASHTRQNVNETHTRRKAENLLFQSLKACYPQWEEKGLIKKPR